jgi:hypothetical protein
VETYHERAALALDHLKATNETISLPLFYRCTRGRLPDNIQHGWDNWVLVRPADYESELKTSLITITFNLVHFVVNGGDIWNAKVVIVCKLHNVAGRLLSTNSSSTSGKCKLAGLTGSSSSSFKQPKTEY